MKIIKRSLVVLLILIIGAWMAAFVTVNHRTHEYAPVSEPQLSAAKAYLADNITPVPNDFEWKMFTTEAGAQLRTGLLERPSPKGTVIVVPGFTGSIEMIMREITQIHAAGYRVGAIEYRGQGMSHRPLPAQPEKGYVEDYGLLADELAQYANEVRDTQLPLFFFSISKGGHITMRMAAEHDLGVDAFALIVPMIQINSGEIAYDDLATFSDMTNRLGLGAAYAPGADSWSADQHPLGQATGCNANPATAQTQSALFATKEKLRTQGVTYKWLHESIKSSEKLLDPVFVKTIRQPVKIYTAGIDELVLTDKAEQFCASLENCQTKHYAESRHCITREDYDLYDGIIADAVAHFDAHAIGSVR